MHTFQHPNTLNFFGLFPKFLALSVTRTMPTSWLEKLRRKLSTSDVLAINRIITQILQNFPHLLCQELI